MAGYVAAMPKRDFVQVFFYYNFVKTHSAIRMTPAMAAGVEQSRAAVARANEPAT